MVKRLINTSLQVKVALVTIATFLLLGLVVSVIAYRLIYPSFLEVEKVAALRNLARCQNAIDLEVQLMEELCGDWSSWTDTYEFVNGSRPGYVENNLIHETFVDYDVQLVFVMDQNRRMVWGKIYDPMFERELSLEDLGQPRLAENLVVLQESSSDDISEKYASGVINTEYGPMVVVSLPVLQSNDQGPARGSFIMGRFLTRSVIEAKSSQIQVPFGLLPSHESSGKGEEFESLKRKLDPEKGSYVGVTDQELLLYSAYPDLEGETAFIIHTRFARDISDEGLRVIRFGLGVATVSILLVLLVFRFLLRKLVLDPVMILSKFMSDIKESGLSGPRLSMERTDEIGVLANRMNDTVSSLAQLRILQGLLPICACCKRIRDDQGYWEQIEGYISHHSEADFTHSLCPECVDEYYPEIKETKP